MNCVRQKSIEAASDNRAETATATTNSDLQGVEIHVFEMIYNTFTKPVRFSKRVHTAIKI